MSEEKATEEEKEKEEKAAGAELKTKTPHSDVGKYFLTKCGTLQNGVYIIYLYIYIM